MNWIGGSRNRLKQKYEKKLQKEFFEKKRFELRHTTAKRQEKPPIFSVSQDLLTLNSLCAGKRKHQEEGSVKNVDLDKAINSQKSKHKDVLLNSSPCETPSLISIMDAKSDREDKLKIQSFGPSSFSNSTSSSAFQAAPGNRSKNRTPSTSKQPHMDSHPLELHTKWVSEDFQKIPLNKYHVKPKVNVKVNGKSETRQQPVVSYTSIAKPLPAFVRIDSATNLTHSAEAESKMEVGQCYKQNCDNLKKSKTSVYQACEILKDSEDMSLTADLYQPHVMPKDGTTTETHCGMPHGTIDDLNINLIHQFKAQNVTEYFKFKISPCSGTSGYTVNPRNRELTPKLPYMKQPVKSDLVSRNVETGIDRLGRLDFWENGTEVGRNYITEKYQQFGDSVCVIDRNDSNAENKYSFAAREQRSEFYEGQEMTEHLYDCNELYYKKFTACGNVDTNSRPRQQDVQSDSLGLSKIGRKRLMNEMGVDRSDHLRGSEGRVRSPILLYKLRREDQCLNSHPKKCRKYKTLDLDIVGEISAGYDSKMVSERGLYKDDCGSLKGRAYGRIMRDNSGWDLDGYLESEDGGRGKHHALMTKDDSFYAPREVYLTEPERSISKLDKTSTVCQFVPPGNKRFCDDNHGSCFDRYEVDKDIELSCTKKENNHPEIHEEGKLTKEKFIIEQEGIKTSLTPNVQSSPSSLTSDQCSSLFHKTPTISYAFKSRTPLLMHLNEIKTSSNYTTIHKSDVEQRSLKPSVDFGSGLSESTVNDESMKKAKLETSKLSVDGETLNFRTFSQPQNSPNRENVCYEDSVTPLEKNIVVDPQEIPTIEDDKITESAWIHKTGKDHDKTTTDKTLNKVCCNGVTNENNNINCTRNENTGFISDLSEDIPQEEVTQQYTLTDRANHRGMIPTLFKREDTQSRHSTPGRLFHTNHVFPQKQPMSSPINKKQHQSNHSALCNKSAAKQFELCLDDSAYGQSGIGNDVIHLQQHDQIISPKQSFFNQQENRKTIDTDYFQNNDEEIFTSSNICSSAADVFVYENPNLNTPDHRSKCTNVVIENNVEIASTSKQSPLISKINRHGYFMSLVTFDTYKARSMYTNHSLQNRRFHHANKSQRADVDDDHCLSPQICHVATQEVFEEVMQLDTGSHNVHRGMRDTVSSSQGGDEDTRISNGTQERAKVQTSEGTYTEQRFTDQRDSRNDLNASGKIVVRASRLESVITDGDESDGGGRRHLLSDNDNNENVDEVIKSGERSDKVILHSSSEVLTGEVENVGVTEKSGRKRFDDVAQSLSKVVSDRMVNEAVTMTNTVNKFEYDRDNTFLGLSSEQLKHESHDNMMYTDLDGNDAVYVRGRCGNMKVSGKAGNCSESVAHRSMKNMGNCKCGEISIDNEWALVEQHGGDIRNTNVLVMDEQTRDRNVTKEDISNDRVYDKESGEEHMIEEQMDNDNVNDNRVDEELSYEEHNGRETEDNDEGDIEREGIFLNGDIKIKQNSGVAVNTCENINKHTSHCQPCVVNDHNLIKSESDGATRMMFVGSAFLTTDNLECESVTHNKHVGVQATVSMRDIALSPIFRNEL